jgi:hypothetical protein
MAVDIALQKMFEELEFKQKTQQLKVDKIGTAIMVINSLKDGFVASKKLKDEATDLAAQVLVRELKDF